jgi:predicted nuclease of predicted toxin-antitoxin system
VKLLFDENLSVRLVSRLAASYLASAHVDQVGLHGKSDTVIWLMPESTASRSRRRTTTSDK